MPSGRDGNLHARKGSTAVKLKVLVQDEEGGGYWAEVPSLPGCVSSGDTCEEALANIREAAEGWLPAAADQYQPEHWAQEPAF
jgi:predicted RNase H-like HicB family nuclease